MGFSDGGQFNVIPASGKIYDITHADTAEHSVALPAGYPANTKAMVVQAYRTAGTSNFHATSVSGVVLGWKIGTALSGLWLRATDGLFYYHLEVANDVWEIYALGYITG